MWMLDPPICQRLKHTLLKRPQQVYPANSSSLNVDVGSTNPPATQVHNYIQQMIDTGAQQMTPFQIILSESNEVPPL